MGPERTLLFHNDRKSSAVSKDFTKISKEYLTGAISSAELTLVRMQCTHMNENQKRMHDTSLGEVQKSLIIPAPMPFD
jgi:hypothetical protein